MRSLLTSSKGDPIGLTLGNHIPYDLAYKGMSYACLAGEEKPIKHHSMNILMVPSDGIASGAISRPRHVIADQQRVAE